MPVQPAPPVDSVDKKGPIEYLIAIAIILLGRVRPAQEQIHTAVILVFAIGFKPLFKCELAI